MELGLVNKIDINEEMQQSYLDYAMSVIVSRALPDARDGLKPVQRRILYAMYDMGLRANSAHKKSARIVGEVLGKYHPHGDSSVYEAMARQAQDFSMRYMLVDGQGNFGSVDGDPPAAMRYTEARLAAPALDMLTEIGKDTVDFSANFDDTLMEPSVLPSSIPNLLVNGGSGIAVGMSTSIPPHNLTEVVDALIYMLENWTKLDDISVEQLMQFVKGPDFPTGGIILQDKDAGSLEASYGSGRGRIKIQARVHIEEMGRNKNRLIVTELPYAVNKSKLIGRIANLVRDGKIDGVTDLRDESDRQGMRIVIELTKNVEPEDVLGKLYKSTPMQSTFSIIMLALVNGEPRMLSLKQALRVFVEHRLDVIRRRTEFDLRKAKERAHVLEGYLVAIKNLDEVIALIRRAPDVPTARKRLMKKFKLSEIQAQAILDMQLRRLAALERKKIEQEYKELKKIIKGLEALLKSPKKMRGLVTEELMKVKEAYGDRRRTRIISVDGEEDRSTLLTSADLLPEKTVWVGVMSNGTVSRTRDDKSPRPSGKEAPKWLVKVSTNDTLYFVSEKGKAAAVAVHTLPEAQKLSDGTLWHKVSPLKPSDKLGAVFSLPAKRSELAEDTFVLTVTRGGMVKKSVVDELPGPSAESFRMLRVNDGDVLGWVVLTDGKKDILLATSSGMGIRFKEDDVRAMGLVAAGVNGVKLGVGDLVVGAEVLPQKWENIFIITSDGKGKRITPKDFPTQGRYGKGVILWKLPDGERLAGLAVGKETLGITLHLLRAAAKSARLDDAPLRKRATVRGGVVQEVKLGDAIIGLTASWEVERFVDKIKEKKKKKK
ncbi:MAG: DNA gyrase subunit A [Anaerolineae bacterium]|nr:DNA gyrase subunit A [Anaerolineae bacterium]MBT7191506.1 DNA gyrase subunit A [Anaerolineae bacterium]MBT7988451.1 DNA gyrase subunit A [Anaerolineae bacterium]